uniref:DDE Tnp4 domain-containing protein n=1 Tax=Fundulus heteroclitus TaxID=8078 RepID=A0A3Q2Q2W5_FUNHE
MSVEDFSYFLERVTPHIIKKDTHPRKAISPRDRLSVTLRFLATGKCVFKKNISYIQTQLQMPDEWTSWTAIARDFENKWQFPHCLGAIDGKHVFIQPPGNSGSMFYNYNSRFSILLMAVVDANYKFVYASAGTQGRVSDAGVFAHSDLRDALDTGTLNFPPDGTLPGTDNVMPYMFIGDDRIFNYGLSRARRVVENAFGVLVNRFRVYRTTICLHPDKVVTIVFTCLCLHNFLRQRGGALQSISSGQARNPSMEAKRQREVLCQYFVSPAGSVSWQQNMV